jgi:WD40 repeat protein
METAEKLLAGGRHGAVVVPGKSSASTLIRYLTGELQPQMPPGKPLSMETVTLLRRWIDEGARIDTMTIRPTTNDPRPTSAGHRAPGTGHGSTATPAPVTALAFSPDGKWLAAGGYRAVRLLDPASGAVLRTLAGPFDQLHALAWSPDGRTLAAAGGLPGGFGEVCLWDTTAWGTPWVAREHADTIYGLSWRPGTREFATASIDKSVRIWNADTGKPLRTLKDHADAVFGIAYSPDGKWLATGSADRSVKLYQTEEYRHVATVAGHGDTVTALGFTAKSDLLVTACADKKARVWPVKTGAITNPLRDPGEADAISALAFSQDGGTFAWGGPNRRVKVFNGELTAEKRILSDAADWVYAVAVSPDGRIIAAGAADGKLYLWNEPDGRLLTAKTLTARGDKLGTADERR